MRRDLLLLALALAACAPSEVDFDGDGTLDAGDCAPADPSIHPEAADPFGDGIDQDCDGGDGVDRDGDGWPANEELAAAPEQYDCNDNDPAVNPGATEVVGDDVDQDCDGTDGFVDVSIVLSPEVPRTGDALTVAVTTAAEYVVRWRVDDAYRDSLEDLLTVPASETAKAQIWQVEVTPLDGGRAIFGSRQTATRVIANTAPTLDSLTLSPAEPSELAPAVATATGLDDPDAADAPVVLYRWSVNAQEVAGWTAPQLPGDFFDKGDTLAVQATPVDGEDAGPSLQAGPLVAANVPPSLLAASVSPAVPTEASTLALSLEGWSDPDPADSSPGFAVEWPIDGQAVATSATLDGASFDRDQQIVAVVTPFDGEAYGEPVSTAAAVVANSPPLAASVAIVTAAPTAADPLQAEVSGAYDPDPADSIAWSWEWLVDAAVVGTTATLPAGVAVRGDVVTVVATPSDGSAQGLPLTSAPAVIANSPPSLGSVLLPSAPQAGDGSIAATLEGWADADGDPPGATYAWDVDGAAIPGVTGDLLPEQHWSRGAVVTVVVTPTDGAASGAPVTATTTVGNSPPSLTQVVLTPDPPRAIDATLTAQASGWSDTDGDLEVVLWSWRVDGAVVPGEDSPSLAATWFGRGDTIEVTATPFDGLLAGAPVTASVVAANSAPALSGVQLLPDPAFSSSLSLEAVPQGWADADGDPPGSSFAWLVDGAPVAETGAVLAGPFPRGTEVTVTVTPTDGADPGPAVSASTVVSNSPRSLAGVVFEPASPTSADPLVRAVPQGWADGDGDPPGYRFAWTVDGAPVPSALGDQLVAAHWSRGQSVAVTVTPADGADDGVAVGAAVLVGDARPSLTGVTLEPAAPTVDQPVVATAVGWSDSDGDLPDVSWSWTVGGLPVAVATDTLPAGTFARGQVLVATATPQDGGGPGAPVSGQALASNSSPALAGVSLQPGSVYADTPLLSATALGWDDADGDPEQVAWSWTVAGSDAGVAGPVLTGVALARGAVVEVTATPFDGEGSGAPVTTSTVVLNRPPMASAVTLSPPVATVATPFLEAVPSGWDDADGDPEAWTWAWTVDGVPVGGASSVLAGGSWVRG